MKLSCMEQATTLYPEWIVCCICFIIPWGSHVWNKLRPIHTPRMLPALVSDNCSRFWSIIQHVLQCVLASGTLSQLTVLFNAHCVQSQGFVYKFRSSFSSTKNTSLGAILCPKCFSDMVPRVSFHKSLGAPCPVGAILPLKCFSEMVPWMTFHKHLGAPFLLQQV